MNSPVFQVEHGAGHSGGLFNIEKTPLFQCSQIWVLSSISSPRTFVDDLNVGRA